ncbi:hypothetical protein [Legionella feeleii]|uniref:Uncharacterized protein n=1 Tax=Legionella feeleii TaxID=453 RepID=A0A378IS93_9GAMM|nr:hypothetical protein [Legionella feeleii]STX37963.1 Uncharacterised protein [Legionella feeleii]
MKKFFVGLKKTKKTPVKSEVPTQQSPFLEESKQKETENRDFFSDPRMRDLSDIGEKKALGYLPLARIREAGYDVFQTSLLLKKKGLKILVIPAALPEEIYAYNPETKKFIHMADKKMYDVVPKGKFYSIQSGALVAYDIEAVDLFLQQHAKLIDDENQSETIDEHKWPMNAADFVEMLFRKTAQSKEMNNLIHTIYEEMPTLITSFKME